MIAISEIRLYDILIHKFKLKDVDAKEIIAEIAIANEKTDIIVTNKIDDKFKNFKDIFLTKEDKTDMIKWMFIFWIGSIITTLGSLITIIKFFKP